MNKLSIFRVTEREEFLEASKEELRVLIAIAEADGELDPAEIARLCKISKARTSAAISFWREAGVLTAEKRTEPTLTEEFEERLRRGDISEEPARKVADDIRDNGLSELLGECARLMKKTAFSTTEVKKISALSTQYALSCEYVATLAAYLAENGKLTPTRLVDEALKLVGRDIDSEEALLSYINERENESTVERELRRLFGIHNRATTPKEKEYFRKWSEEYGYFTEIIGEAYDICVNATAKLSFPYIDKILTAWSDANCRTLAECRSFKEARDNEKSEAKKQRVNAKKDTAPKPRYGDFDIGDAFQKALERSYGKSEKPKSDN